MWERHAVPLTANLNSQRNINKRSVDEFFFRFYYCIRGIERYGGSFRSYFATFIGEMVFFRVQGWLIRGLDSFKSGAIPFQQFLKVRKLEVLVILVRDGRSKYQRIGERWEIV